MGKRGRLRWGKRVKGGNRGKGKLWMGRGEKGVGLRVRKGEVKDGKRGKG